MNFKVSRFCEHERHRKSTRRTLWQQNWIVQWYLEYKFNPTNARCKKNRYKGVRMAFQFGRINDVLPCVLTTLSVAARRPLWWMWVVPMSRRSSVLITIKRPSLRHTRRWAAIHLVWTGCEQQQFSTKNIAETNSSPLKVIGPKIYCNFLLDVQFSGVIVSFREGSRVAHLFDLYPNIRYNMWEILHTLWGLQWHQTIQRRISFQAFWSQGGSYGLGVSKLWIMRFFVEYRFTKHVRSMTLWDLDYWSILPGCWGALWPVGWEIQGVRWKNETSKVDVSKVVGEDAEACKL